MVGDPDQIYQAFLNIVINAIQAMPDGGRLRVRVEEAGDWGAVGLFALMHAGAEVIMPQNSQRGTLAAISNAWDGLPRACSIPGSSMSGLGAAT